MHGKSRVATVFSYGGDVFEFDIAVVELVAEAEKLEEYARNLFDAELPKHYPRMAASAGRRSREARILEPGGVVPLDPLGEVVASIAWKP